MYMDFENYVDERMLVSHDAMGTKEIKIKVLEVEDEQYPLRWKFGDRAKVKKILLTIKHLKTQQVEEGEFDLSLIEKEMKETRHYSSTNRWLSVTDIKSGYVIYTKHTVLLSDAMALDYIVI
ncbi:MAG: hypothetical protein NPMRIOTA_370006 [Nitrosopumilales archaeon]|nr:MAG: hypothetical protein NPMRIOTA_370006 [Nitrosopumilales archaeon]